MHEREDLIDEIAETLSDTCDMDVSWHQYATAIVDRLIKIGTLIPSHSYVALNEIAAERERQVSVEGWTTEHDDQHGNAQLARAAAAYALNTAAMTYSNQGSQQAIKGDAVAQWPWSAEWWKPTTPRRDLVKAGALIVAEIDRLDRIAADEIPT